MADGHRYRLGCDIGGTFTDFVLYDKDQAGYRIHKVLTTPADPSEAVETGVVELAAEAGDFLSETEYLIHGTTLVINAVIERKGAPTALITTAGFRDILEMRREIRYDIYDVAAVYPTPLVERALRFEVPERVHADGNVRSPLDEDAVRHTLKQIGERGITSIAVALLHAYANPRHEQRIAELAGEVLPSVSITLSSDVLPEIKEFERTATTCVNAYVKPLVADYIGRLQGRLGAHGYTRGLNLMLSSGGTISPETAKAYPVRLIESGPVGGALAAARLGEQAGFEHALMFDMGGTTAKSCLVNGGVVPIANTYEVDRVHRFKKGSGTPIGIPTVDIIEIGAGGGSIAAINDMGLLTVGPASAGADPGPICYGRGGTQPTVTDADLILGYLDPAYFLGGGMPLDQDAATRGIEAAVAEPLGLSVLNAAWGIHEIVNENMATAMRMYVTEKGGDMSNAAIVAIGGAGPVHATDFARRLGASTVIVPRGAGVYSALGFLVAPVSFEAARTRLTDLQTASGGALDGSYEPLEAETGELIAEAAPNRPVKFRRAADVRYTGQGATLRIDVYPGMSGEDLRTAFLERYADRYGTAYDDMDVQLVTYRVTATASEGSSLLTRPFEASGDDPLKPPRMAYSPLNRQLVEHDVYAMEHLQPGMHISGPAIVEEASSTLVIDFLDTMEVDPGGWLTVTLGGRAR